MSLYRYDPPAGSPPMEGFTRATAGGPIVCGACGCRLEASASPIDSNGDATATWRHFEGLPGRDARGCRVECVDVAHGRDGRAL